MWGGGEYPLNFEFYDYDVDPSELEAGTIVGEANTIGPDQYLLWDGEGIVAISKSRYE